METAVQETLFKQAVEQHMGIFMKTVRGFARDAADQDDLLQEMLLSAWQALPAYDASSKLTTFLYRVAHNRALNWQRSRTRYWRKLAGFTADMAIGSGADDTSASAAQIDWLYAVIQRLAPLDRTLIMLQLDRLPHGDIAQVTGLSESNVGVRLHRIRQWLITQKPGDPHEH